MTFAGPLFERLVLAPGLRRRHLLRALTALLLTEYRLVHLPLVNCDFLRVLNRKLHLVASDLDHRHDDVVAEDDALALLALDEEHG